MLPDLSLLDRELMQRLRGAGVTPQMVRHLTHGPDTLFSPLQPTRECTYSDEPAAKLVREVFCLSPFHIRFVEDLLIVSDYVGGAPDAVMGAGETTAVLYRTARQTERVESLLDLGCGAGSLALLLARSARRVIATDVNPRAIALCQFNAEINGICNMECRLGSLFDPLAGDRFDLIVSQPPYYPGTTETYLHGGEHGYELTEELLIRVTDHLTDTGRAVIHASWPVDRDLPAIPATIAEYTPGIGEVPGTRHSVCVIACAEAHSNRQVHIAPEQWGCPLPLS